MEWSGTNRRVVDSVFSFACDDGLGSRPIIATGSAFKDAWNAARNGADDGSDASAKLCRGDRAPQLLGNQRGTKLDALSDADDDEGRMDVDVPRECLRGGYTAEQSARR